MIEHVVVATCQRCVNEYSEKITTVRAFMNRARQKGWTFWRDPDTESWEAYCPYHKK